MRGGGIGNLEIARGFACAALLAACLAGPAAAQDPLATRRGWEAGGQISEYRYEEPGFMSLEGSRFGAVGAYTFVAPQRPFLRIEGRVSFGLLDYVGSGTLSDVPDQILEARALLGGDFGDSRVRWSPYAGAAFRYLYNDLRGVSSTGAVGYQRESIYFYLPVGLTLRTPLGNGWVLAPQLEYDAFVRGEQRSYLSDTGLGLGDVTNRQGSGRGYRGQLMFESRRWTFGAWLHYWNIEDSDPQAAAPGVLVYEPANTTREGGLELRYRF